MSCIRVSTISIMIVVTLVAMSVVLGSARTEDLKRISSETTVQQIIDIPRLTIIEDDKMKTSTSKDTLEVRTEPEIYRSDIQPGTKEQMQFVAIDVCNDLFDFDCHDEIDNCIEQFTKPTGTARIHQPNIRILDRTEGTVHFEISPSMDEQQLVILVPNDKYGIINYVILDKSKSSGSLYTSLSYNCSLWTTLLNKNATPTVWFRGPDVPVIKDHTIEIVKSENDVSQTKSSDKDNNNIIEVPHVEALQNDNFEIDRDNSWHDITNQKPPFNEEISESDKEKEFRKERNQLEVIIIGEPTFEYVKVGRYEVTAVINVTYKAIRSLFKLQVNNVCRKNSVIFESEITSVGNQTIRISGLPMDDNCSFYIPGRTDLKRSYRTPSCDFFINCMPLPDIPAEVHMEAKEAALENWWDVHVRWARPKHAPEKYNVTLRSDRAYSRVLSGNTTETTFYSVFGGGVEVYNVSIMAISATGTAFTSRRDVFPLRPEYNPMVLIMSGASCAVLLAACALLGAAIWWRRRKTSKLRNLYIQSPEYKLSKDCVWEPGPESGVEDNWEVRPEKLLLHEVIGEGAFGVVRKGTLSPGGREVAVKMLKDFPTLEEMRAFRAEMELMKSVGSHPHVISLVGCCSGRKPLIVAEYCSKGDLLTYLRCYWDVMVTKRNAKYYNNNIENTDYRDDIFKNKSQKEHSKLVINKLYDLQGVCDAELTSLDLLSFCRQIAKGMAFLAQNRVVHRDLAARNVLVANDRTLKIADFGLSRDVYQENQYKQKGNGKMPVKWMALESLTHRIYTTQSDVWSFGVVVWEIVTVGGSPYPDVPAARLPRLLRDGYRMPRPNNCSVQLYELMLECWRARPRERPSFTELHSKLDELLHGACADKYLSLELEYEVPPVPKTQSYFKIFLRGNRVRARGESYERPLKAPQSNHYTSTPAVKPQPV